ncbi:MAG: FecR family protein [Bacteroidales bacterium]|nr:FecR family protein [Bacteroidales bacterium]
MNEDQLYRIIARVLNGSAKLTDHNKLNVWRSQSAENERLFQKLKDNWETKHIRIPFEGENKHIQQILNKSRYSYTERSIEKMTPIYILKIAAGILILISLSFLAGTIKSDLKKEVKITEVKVPRGNRAEVMLPDSTVVWLGHQSKISHPIEFNSRQRVVYLSGEAYFKVNKNKKPFIVKTTGPDIKVTGTEFYVLDYHGEGVFETSLINGSIELHTKNHSVYKVKPGQNILYNKKTGKINSGSFDSNYYNFWKNGEYSFKDQSFSNLAQKMKRIYNVEIIFEDQSLMDKTFTGSMNTEDNVYTLLEIFRKSSLVPFKYTIDEKKIIIQTQ